MKKKLLLVCGTRPEVVKLAPVLIHGRKDYPQFLYTCCFTGQHDGLARDVMAFWGMEPDYNLGLMTPDQSLDYLTSEGLNRLAPVIGREKPDFCVVQGDTTSAFIGALSAFYHGVPVVHVEAGLRTGDRMLPFPEELNRRMIDQLSTFHFAPTEQARDNLNREGLQGKVFVVGNTAVDALQMVTDRLAVDAQLIDNPVRQLMVPGKQNLLVTIHRRENIGDNLAGICEAVREIAEGSSEINIVWPVHPNPAVRACVGNRLENLSNVHLVAPPVYPAFIWLLREASLVLTDSGGLQEEAPYLGTPVLVLREQSDRPESISAGVARLVGVERKRIVDTVNHLLDDTGILDGMSRRCSPYGEPGASGRILDILSKYRGPGG